MTKKYAERERRKKWIQTCIISTNTIVDCANIDLRRILKIIMKTKDDRHDEKTEKRDRNDRRTNADETAGTRARNDGRTCPKWRGNVPEMTGQRARNDGATCPKWRENATEMIEGEVCNDERIAEVYGCKTSSQNNLYWLASKYTGNEENNLILIQNPL